MGSPSSARRVGRRRELDKLFLPLSSHEDEEEEDHLTLWRIGLYDGLLLVLGQDLLGNCVNMNGAPRMRTPSRRSGARSCHAPGGMAA